MFQLDYGDHRPLYEQIKEKIKELIISGVLSANDKIPSVRELAATLAINPNTIQKAYKDLENDGYIYSQKSKGSFVAPHENTAEPSKIFELKKNLTSTVKELKFLGVTCKALCDELIKIYEEE